MIQIDMEMPRSCGDCRFCTNYRQMDCARCHAVGDYGGREIPECSTSELYAGRQEWCPLKETPTWHVVADGDLPEEKGFYQCTISDNQKNEVFIADVYNETTGFFSNNEIYEVIAWRELPEPWEGENNEIC